MTEIRLSRDSSLRSLSATDPSVRLFLRHVVATLAYRAGKTVRGTPAEFGDFRAAPDSRSAREILVHMGDLMDWVLSQLKGSGKWNDSTPLEWEQEIARFFAALDAVDGYLASEAAIGYEPARMFQGGLADALTHTGQLAMLRRLSGNRMKGESYNRAEIQVGRVGLEQTPANPKYEFD